MKEAFELIKERLEELINEPRCLHEYDDCCDGLNEAIKIVSEVEAEFKEGCTLCYLGSPCEYQNKDVRVPDELIGWIPCEKELPEKSGRYTVTEDVISLDTGKKFDTRVSYDIEYDAKEGRWRRGNHLKVIAWKYLDKPIFLFH